MPFARFESQQNGSNNSRLLCIKSISPGVKRAWVLENRQNDNFTSSYSEVIEDPDELQS